MKNGFLWNHGEMTNQLLVTLGGRVECTQFGGISFEIELSTAQLTIWLQVSTWQRPKNKLYRIYQY